MAKIWILIAGIVIVGIAAYFMMAGNKAMAPAPGEAIPLTTATSAPAMQQTITLGTQNNSSESGTAVLMEKDGKTVVTLTMMGAPTDVPQPAHIHMGACPNVGAVVYPLDNVVNGKSVTTLDVTFAKLQSQLPLGINVHKSVPESKVYVSCGDLAFPSAAGTAPAKTSATSAPLPPTNGTRPGY